MVEQTSPENSVIKLGCRLVAARSPAALCLLAFALIAILLPVAGCGGSTKAGVTVTVFAQPATSTQEFESRLDQLRNDLKMPGMSASIAKDQRIVWAKGFGMADVENGIPATPTTSFHLASLTKTFCSTVLLQLVDQGLVSLDDPLSKYGVVLSNSGSAQVKHLLTHTSSGLPGSSFQYDGNRYALLDNVILGSSGKPFAQLVTERILRPLNLPNSAPNVLTNSEFSFAGLDKQQFTSNLAKPYTVDNSGKPVPSAYPDHFSCAAGLISSANDVAQYSMAIDRDAFLQPATKNLAFTNFSLSTGQTSPYGLGWFVQNLNGTKIVWHYGLWTANSSLIVKIPARGLTFVLLANSDLLSRDFNLVAGDVMVSPFAREFMNAFVNGNTALP